MYDGPRNITILVDNDSWILAYAEKLTAALTERNYKCKIARSQGELDHGWANFILGCTQILPSIVLSRFQHNLVVHESALPEGKGFAPMSWQILEGKTEISVCLIEAVEQPDSGNIWLQDHIELCGDELNADWRALQGEKTVDMCLRFVEEYESLVPVEQSGEESFYPKRTPEDSELQVGRTIAEQFNLLRITNNTDYPAFFYFNQRKYVVKIEKADD